MISYLIAVAVSGLVIGALGRLAIPGPNPMGIGMTILCGVGGSLLGGIVGRLLGLRSFGFLLAVLGAAGLVYLATGSMNRRRGFFDGGGVLGGRRRGLF